MKRKTRNRLSAAAIVLALTVVLAALVSERIEGETPPVVESPSPEVTEQETPVIVQQDLPRSAAPALPSSPSVMSGETEEHFDEASAPDFHGYEYRWKPLEEIPLSDELQQATFDACELYGVDMALILGMMERESTFQPDAESEHCWGLMQIHSINYDWLMEDEGIDATTYEGNIQAGTLIISRFLEEYNSIHLALMAYNCGEAGAKELWDEGVYSTAYTRAVVSSQAEWSAVLDAAWG